MIYLISSHVKLWNVKTHIFYTRHLDKAEYYVQLLNNHSKTLKSISMLGNRALEIYDHQVDPYKIINEMKANINPEASKLFKEYCLNENQTFTCEKIECIDFNNFK